jgi:histidinol-phosphate phosphatase family protein
MNNNGILTITPALAAIFLDRDGVINVNRDDYVKSWDEFEFIPGAKEALKRINESDYMLIIITNQSPIGRGIFSTETLDDIHNRMLHELGKAGAHIDAIYYCPHKPDDGCDCRKPKPGLIIRAANDFNIDLNSSWMIGDSDSDLEAGKKAGCKTAKVDSKNSLLKVVEEILG